MTDSIDRLLEYQIRSRHFPGALVHVERAGKVLARMEFRRAAAQL